MVNIDLLKDTIIVSRHKTLTEVYSEMGLTKRKFGTRMANKSFDAEEIGKIINILDLSWEETKAIFFS